MSRYIDADALHDALKTKQLWVVRCGDKHNEGYTYDQVHFAIDDAPSIDIEPKRGENLRAGYPSLFECSVCGASCDDTIPWGCDINFCPNCGAKMK